MRTFILCNKFTFDGPTQKRGHKTTNQGLRTSGKTLFFQSQKSKRSKTTGKSNHTGCNNGKHNKGRKKEKKSKKTTSRKVETFAHKILKKLEKTENAQERLRRTQQR